MGKGMSFHFQNQLMKFRLGSLILDNQVKKWCWQVSPAACWNLGNCKGSCKTGCPKSLQKLLSNIIENNLLALSRTRVLIGKLQNAHLFDLLHGRHSSRQRFTMASVTKGVCIFPNFQIGHFLPAEQQDSSEFRRWHIDIYPTPKPGEHPLGSTTKDSLTEPCPLQQPCAGSSRWAPAAERIMGLTCIARHIPHIHFRN